jgi:integration host factor subunit beta
MLNKHAIKKMLAKKFPITQNEAEHVVNNIFNFMMLEMKNDNRIEIRNFGTLSLRVRESRLARNPRNNELVKVGERKKIYFRAGKLLLEMVNNQVA